MAGGVLYLAVTFSPLGVKATISIVLFAVLTIAMVLMGVSGQALSPGRQLRAISAYRRSPKLWVLADAPDRRGVVLDRSPFLDADQDGEAVVELLDELESAAFDLSVERV